ncbi:MAG: DNA-deoxyinosine glycosylase [Coriobacteriales bacterium]
MQRQSLQHTIDPIFDERSQVLMLGSFPSPKSREIGFYYGHPQNRMWKVLPAVFGVDEVLDTNEKREAFLHEQGIAMWDVIASCTIEGASDASIRDVVPNDLSRIFRVARIEQVFTTGAKATELYRRYQLPFYGMEPCKLPSTSAANASWSLERLVDAYRVIPAALKE